MKEHLERPRVSKLAEAPMRTLWMTAALFVGASPAMAQTYGGGGITVQQATLDWDVPGQRTANAVGCIGGVGYGVTDGKRRGFEGHYCGGRYTQMAMAGGHFGLQSKRAGAWLTLYNTLGAGWVGVSGEQSGRFDGLFVYTRPSLGGGFALGQGLALEASAFLSVPVNLLRVDGGDIDPKLVFPHVGVQATLLFGNFTRRREALPEAPVQPRGPQDYGRPPPPREGPQGGPPPRVAPAPKAAPAPSGPIRPGDLPRADQPSGPAPAPRDPAPPAPQDDRPLAIPG